MNSKVICSMQFLVDLRSTQPTKFKIFYQTHVKKLNFLLPYSQKLRITRHVVIFYKIIKDEESIDEFPYSTRCPLG